MNKEEKGMKDSIRRPRHNGPCKEEKIKVARPCAKKRRRTNYETSFDRKTRWDKTIEKIKDAMESSSSVRHWETWFRARDGWLKVEISGVT